MDVGQYIPQGCAAQAGNGVVCASTHWVRSDGFGPQVDHPDTLRIAHNMASIFGKQGQYEKALEWYQRALAGKEKALGVDHPDTLSKMGQGLARDS